MAPANSSTIRAALYLRMSSGRQERSIGEQRDELVRFAKRQGYKIVREYIDEAISGDDTARRTSFLKMRDESSSGDFDLVLCWDQDRFGRFDPIEAGHWILPFRNAGVELETIAQGRISWHDFAGRLLYVVQQEGKHQFLRDLSRNSLRGLIARAKQGLWPGGAAPYGYEIGDDGRLVLGDPVKVAAVRRVFRLRLQRRGYRSIARELNSDKVPAPGGSQWSHDAVRIVIERESYTGTVTLGGRRQGKYHTTDDGEISTVRSGKRQKSQAVRVEDAHPAIVDRETWEEARGLKSSLRPHWRDGSEGAPLAGLLYCGCCGHVMYAQSLQRKAGQKSPNYICGTYHKGRGCGYCSVPQSAILRALAEAIRQRVLRGSRKGLEEAIGRELRKRSETATRSTDSSSVSKQLSRLDRQIDQAAERLVRVDDSIASKVEEKLLDLKRQRDELARSLSPIPKKSPSLDPKKVAAEAWRLVEVFEKSSPARLRNELSKVLDRVVLEFRPGQKHGRGQSFEFVRASATLCSKESVSPAAWSLIVEGRGIEITAADLRRHSEHITTKQKSKTKDLDLVRRLLAEFKTRREQVVEWTRLTGKSRRTFELKLRELKAA